MLWGAVAVGPTAGVSGVVVEGSRRIGEAQGTTAVAGSALRVILAR